MQLTLSPYKTSFGQKVKGMQTVTGHPTRTFILQKSTFGWCVHELDNAKSPTSMLRFRSHALTPNPYTWVAQAEALAAIQNAPEQRA